MTTAYTSLLGLALPVQGELTGVWGDTVNNSITSLLDTSVAGTTNVSTDTDVTLTTTTGAANTARQAILLFSGARTALRTVTAPAQSKIYTVINATTGGFSVKLVGVGPTTGLTIPNGASAVVAWNGSDFVEVGSGSIGNLVVNGTLTVTGATTLQSTLAVTGNITNTAGTANGVAYLNGSKVVTSGSALTFDGNNLGVGNNLATTIDNNNGSGKLVVGTGTGSNGMTIYSGSTSGNEARITFANSSTGAGAYAAQISYKSGDGAVLIYNNNAERYRINSDGTAIWSISGSEQMRLTSTGLGIGTSSPTNPLTIYSSSAHIALQNATTGAGASDGSRFQLSGNDLFIVNREAASIQLYTTDTLRATLDSSGNLGLGVTPSAWRSEFKVLQLNARTSLFGSADSTFLSTNEYIDSAGQSRYIQTGSATRYRQDDRSHIWSYAASGTAGNAITFTQAMTLDASGNLGIGTTAPFGKLQVSLNDGQTAYFSSAIAALGTTAISLGYATTGGTNAMAKIIGQRINDGSGRSDLALAVRSVDDNASATIADAKLFVSGTNGNVGIGTSSPATKLEISGNGELLRFDGSSGQDRSVYFRNVGSGKTAKILTDGTLALETNSTTSITFATNGSERARIDSSGNLLVGTTTTRCRITALGTTASFPTLGTATGTALFCPNDNAYGTMFGSANTGVGWIQQQRVDATATAYDLCIQPSGGNLVVGSSGGDVGKLYVRIDSTTLPVVQLQNEGATGQMMTFRTNGNSQVGSISFSAAGTSYNTSSDYRLKNTIAPMTGALAKVAQLNPVTYKWNFDGSDGQGFIAHELAEVCPDAVTGEKDAVDAEGNPQYQGIDVSFLVATLTAAIQEQQAIIESLKARLDAANL